MIQARKKVKTWLLLICLILINSFSVTQLSAATVKKLPSIDPFKPLLYDLLRRFPDEPKTKLIIVSASEQKLFLIENLKVTRSYTISTAKAGLGHDEGSNKTPLGVHSIVEKIGEKAREATIFRARKNTKRIAKILRKPGTKSIGDVITSRILWLSGIEPGINQGGKVDSQARFIYIHGTDEEGRLGKPVSHGCVRMSNQDVIELFDKVPVGTLVNIVE